MGPLEPSPHVRQLRVVGSPCSVPPIRTDLPRRRYHHHCLTQHESSGLLGTVSAEVSTMGDMNKPLKQVLRIGGVIVGLGAAVWAMRDKLLPAPEIPDGPPPRFRTADTSATPGDNLTTVKGIGPVYAERLADVGITSFDELVSADAAAVSEAAGVSESTASSWMEQAANLS